MAPDPIQVEDSDLVVPAAEDEPTRRLFEWLSHRGVAPAYFSSYTRARAIIWGGDPVHAVDAGDVERAIRRRATTATPQQLDNLRVLGKLLLQFYNSAECTGSSPSLTAVGPADSGMLPSSSSGSGRGSLDTVEVSKPIPTQRPRSAEHVSLQPSAPIAFEIASSPDAASRTPLSRRSQESVTRETRRAPEPGAPQIEVPPYPTMEVELEVEVSRDRERTPVPQLLEESAADMALELDRSANATPRVEGATGAVPLVPVEEDPADSLAAQPSWTLPAGIVSAWDPNNRDRRPSEILRPPTSPWTVAFAIFVMLCAALAVTHAVMTS